MYPACAILTTCFNFLVWFIQQSDHCPKLALQKDFNTFVIPLQGSHPIIIQRHSSLHFADFSLEPDQPHEPFCLGPNCAILRVTCNMWKESSASVGKKGILLLSGNTAHFFLPVMQRREHWKNRWAGAEAHLMDMMVLSHWSSWGLTFPPYSLWYYPALQSMIL